MHAQNDSRKTSANGRAAFEKRFTREVLEHAAAKGEELEPAEILRRAEQAKRSYMAGLAYKANKARAQKRAPRKEKHSADNLR